MSFSHKGKEVYRNLMNGYAIEIFKDSAKEWRWRIFAENGQIVAISGEGYERHKDLIVVLDRLFPRPEDAVPATAPSEPASGVSRTADIFEGGELHA